MAIEIAEVLETGHGWNRVRGTDGNIYTLQGDYNWRSNNPGNIEYGDFAINQGAIGSGAVPQGRERGFAIFPSLSAGEEARRALQFESPSYRDLTIEQAISRYAPPNENNTQGYINAVTKAAGVPAGTKMSELTPQQQTAFLAAQSKIEGMRPGEIRNAQGIRLPPNEIPNVVASQLSVTPPRVAPNPASMSPDLSLMRNPNMSMAARNAQVTSSGNVPMPRPRPSAPDIVTPSMAALQRPQGNVNATRGVDMLASTANPVTPRLTPAGDNIYSYHIPDMTPTSLVGGMGSLTPMPQRQRLPEIPRTTPGQSQIERTMPSAREIASAPGTTVATYPTQNAGLVPTSNIGQAPTTRSVQSVPYTLQPTAREIAQAPGVTVATIPTTPTRPMNMGSRDSVANAAMGQRVATQMGPAFNQPGFIPNRLSPNPIAPQPGFVPLNQPPIQVTPYGRQMANVPFPRARPTVQPQVRQPMPRMAQTSSPLRVMVNGANSYRAPVQMTPIQALQAQGLSKAQAYNALTQQSPSLEDRVSGRSGLSSYSGTAQSLSS